MNNVWCGCGSARPASGLCWGDREEGRWRRPPGSLQPALLQQGGGLASKGAAGQGPIAEPGILLRSCVVHRTNPACEWDQSQLKQHKQNWISLPHTWLSAAVGTISGCNQGHARTGGRDGRRKGRAEQWDPWERMRRWCGMFLEAVMRYVFFPFCSLSFSKTPCLPLTLLPGRGGPAGRSPSPSSLPGGSLPTASPPSFSPKKHYSHIKQDREREVGASTFTAF